MISVKNERSITPGSHRQVFNTSQRFSTLSHRIIVVFCAIIISSKAIPMEKLSPQPERILFALEGSRNIRNLAGSGHGRHSSAVGTGGEVVRAIAGQDVVLECEAASKSGPSIHWLHQGRRIVQAGEKVADDYEFEVTEDGSISTGSTRSRLFLYCVNPLQAGEYICVADTPTSRNISVRTLVVEDLEGSDRRFSTHRSAKRLLKGKSSSCDKKSKEYDEARIYQWTTRRLVEETNDVRLVCRASGSPRPKITWLNRYEKPITSADAQYQILESGDLVIRKTTFKENMGLYQCVADNGHGIDVVSAFVYPAGKDNNRPAVKYN